jgi:hypothetical protein
MPAQRLLHSDSPAAYGLMFTAACLWDKQIEAALDMKAGFRPIAERM